jgi:hypothetical protein
MDNNEMKSVLTNLLHSKKEFNYHDEQAIIWGNTVKEFADQLKNVFSAGDQAVSRYAVIVIDGEAHIVMKSPLSDDIKIAKADIYIS